MTNLAEPRLQEFPGRWFHGGPKGLSAAGLILSPKETGVLACADTPKDVIADNPARHDRVYITTSFKVAEFFGSYAPHVDVAVYEVVPLGVLEPDPDYKGPDTDESRQCMRARILRETPIPRARRRRILRAMGVNLNA